MNDTTSCKKQREDFHVDQLAGTMNRRDEHRQAAEDTGQEPPQDGSCPGVLLPLERHPRPLPGRCTARSRAARDRGC